MQLTPREIVKELDRYIIGQNEAKKAVAIALRNRYRRNQLPEHLRDEITPKNIIMKGPTGVGKTEIARRLAKIVKAPFVKVEATKFTEVGYVGRDVESMIRDLVEVAVRLVKNEKIKEVETKASDKVYKKIAKALAPSKAQLYSDMSEKDLVAKLYKELKAGEHKNETVEMEIPVAPKNIQLAPGSGIEIGIGDIFGGMLPQKTKKKLIEVEEAYKILMEVESDKLIDEDSVNAEAIRRAETPLAEGGRLGLGFRLGLRRLHRWLYHQVHRLGGLLLGRRVSLLLFGEEHGQVQLEEGQLQAHTAVVVIHDEPLRGQKQTRAQQNQHQQRDQQLIPGQPPAPVVLVSF